MKIKTKKQLNLPQLIEWGFEQKELPPLFYGSREGSLVQFTPGGWVNITGIETTDTFTVTTEEEITEDTVFEHMIEVYKIDNIGWTRSTEHRNVSISQMKNRGSIVPLAYYILNDDLTMALIWTRERGLVE